MRCDGDKIRRLREQMCFTQDKLALLSCLDRRTIQRAEAGSTLNLESLADIAASLKVKVADITIPLDRNDNIVELDFGNNAVVLRKVLSGKILLDVINGCFSGKLSCEVEPATSNIEALASAIEEIEKIIPDPWEWQPDEKFSLANHLRSAVRLSEKLRALDEAGIAVFVGTYTASAIVPHYNPYEGMHTGYDQRPEPVTVCRISLADPGLERIVLRVNDVWEEPKPEPVGDTDDIPF